MSPSVDGVRPSRSRPQRKRQRFFSDGGLLNQFNFVRLQRCANAGCQKTQEDDTCHGFECYVSHGTVAEEVVF